GHVWCVGFIDANTLFSAARGAGGVDGDPVVRIWDLAAGKERLQFRPHEKWGFCLSLSPDGKTLASSGTEDRAVRLGEVASGRLLRRFSGHNNRIWRVAFAPDGKTLASGGLDKLALWDVATGRELRQVPLQHGVSSLVFSPDGKYLAGASGLELMVWEAATLRELGRAQGHYGWGINCLAFAPDGKTLLSGRHHPPI